MSSVMSTPLRKKQSFVDQYTAMSSTVTLLGRKRKSSTVEEKQPGPARKRPMRMTSSQDSYSLSPKEEYVHQLLIFHKKWELASGNEYVIADCDVSTGVLLKGKYHLVKRNLVFHSPDRRQTAALLSCNCDDGIIHQKRLQSTNPSIQENFLDFVSSEVTKYCRHSYAINVLFPDSSLGNSLQNLTHVCYRPSVGGCGCKLFYDGGEDLLFNLNNRDFIHYGLLLSYLHLMVEGRNPLAAFHRAYTHKHSQLSSTQLLPLHKLRLGWNGYARLLAINWTESFACGLCGSDPDVVICDGTSLGLHKQLLQGFNEEDVNILPVIQGSKHTDRVYIPSSKARKLLHQFSGLHQQRNLSNLSPTPLNREQYIHLITLLRKFSHLQSLADVIERISNNGNELTAPDQYRSFLLDLSRNTPATALLQLQCVCIPMQSACISQLSIFHIKIIASVQQGLRFLFY